METLLVDRGLVTTEELSAGASLAPGRPVARVLHAAEIPALLAAGGPSDRTVDQPARFSVGDVVRTRNIHPTGHTRLPRYVRARLGVIDRVHGAHVFPDSNARGDGENPQWLYTVVFTGQELWGDDADPNLRVSIEAWESYLDAA